MISFPLSFYVPKISLFSLIFVTHFANEKLTFDIADSSSFLPINFAFIFFSGTAWLSVYGIGVWDSAFSWITFVGPGVTQKKL